MSDQASRPVQPNTAPVTRPARSAPLPRPVALAQSQAALAQMTGYWDWEV